MHVVERTVSSLESGSDAAIVLLAGDAEGAEAILAKLRTASSTAATPVVLLGAPAGRDFDSNAAILLGADAFYARPVPVERLARKVETYLAPPETRLRAPQPEGASSTQTDGALAATDPLPPASPAEPVAVVRREPEVDKDPSAPMWQPPERTMQLTESGSHLADDGAMEAMHAAASSAIAQAAFAASAGPATSGFAPATPESHPMPPAPAPTPAHAPVPLEPPPAHSAPAHAETWPSPISPRLRDLLLQADRRVFPSAPALDLRFAAGNESPEELVPAELLEHFGAPMGDATDDDPLDAFTYVGAVPPPDVPDAASLAQRKAAGQAPALQSTSRPSEPPPSLSLPIFSSSPDGELDRDADSELDLLGIGPSTSAELQAIESLGGIPVLDDEEDASAQVVSVVTPLPGHATGMRPSSSLPPALPVARGHGSAAPRADLELGEPTPDGHGRQGPLEECGSLRLLWHLVDRRLDVDVMLKVESDGRRGERPIELRLMLVDGDVRRMEGGVALRVLDELARERRLTATAKDEAAAVRQLEAHVAERALTRFELDRRLRNARESILHDAILARSGSFLMRPLDTDAVDRIGKTRLLGGSLVEIMVEGARKRLDPRRVLDLVARGKSVAVHTTADTALRLSEAGIEPELAHLVLQSDGASLQGLLEAAPDDEGLPGIVFALIATGALSTSEQQGARPVTAEVAEAARASVEALAALAEDGDYFAILGVRPDALAREIGTAYAARRRELRTRRLEALGLGDLEPIRAAALAGVDEAFEVLRDERLRARYRSAMTPVV